MNTMHRAIFEKCTKQSGNNYKNCEEAVDFHYRRCLADHFFEDECRDNIYITLTSFCNDGNEKKELSICENLHTSTSGTSSTTQASTTSKSQILKKLTKTSNIITIGAIAGILLLFAIGLLIYCTIRRRRQRKEEEAEGAWGIPGWSGTTTSEHSKEETSKESSKESTWGFGGTTSVETAKDKTSMKTAESKKSKKSKPAPLVPAPAPAASGAHGTQDALGQQSKPSPAPSTAPSGAHGASASPNPGPTPSSSPGFFKRLGGSKPAPAPATPAVPQPKFDGFFESPQGPLPPMPAPAPATIPAPISAPKDKQPHVPTGNTAERRPLVWNKQAAENVYY
ncbi:unnamed protein product [Caenorhabditis nigoni]